MLPVNIVLSQWPLSGCVTLEFTQASHWSPCEHCDVGCVSWLLLFRIAHDCICSAQFVISHLGVSSPSIYHVPGPKLMEIIGVLSGGGWSKEED